MSNVVPNPYLLLAIGVACLVAAWGGYRHGVQTADDACAARAAQAAHTAALAAREHAEADAGLTKPHAWLRPPLPTPTAGDELAVTLWTHDLIEAAGICRRMHETCRTAKE